MRFNASPATVFEKQCSQEGGRVFGGTDRFPIREGGIGARNELNRVASREQLRQVVVSAMASLLEIDEVIFVASETNKWKSA
jgi:hypothetical protein